MNWKRIGALMLLAAGVASCQKTETRQATAERVRPSAAPAPAVGPPRWYKGNLHTHSLWSDGDDFPERIATWYRDRNYQFLAISDHNNLQQGERWLRYANLKKNGVGPATVQYLKDFPTLARTRGDVAGESYEVRLTPFEEYRPKLERLNEFLLIPSEEVTDKFDKKPVHMCATNLGAPIKPQGGMSVVEVIRNNLHAIQLQGRELHRPVLAHLNHPNFGWGVSAEDLAQVVEERFFEVYNGHPVVHHLGDKDRPSVERLWDIANTLRLGTFHAPPVMGLGSDDTHNYHVGGLTRASPGRGWIYVRAKSLSADALIAAMEAGDFYASSGVVLTDVQYDPVAKKLSLEIVPDGDAEFTTQFIGTLSPETPGGATGEVGAVLATAKGPNASYTLTGKEMYVRAMVQSTRAVENPSFEGQKKQAWTQPIGWSVPVSRE